MNRKLQIILILFLVTVHFSFSQVKAYEPSTFYMCYKGDLSELFDLTLKILEVIRDQDLENLEIKFYSTESDAVDQVNHIVTQKAFKVVVSCTTVYVRVTDKQTEEYDVTSLNLCFSSPINLYKKTPPIINCPIDETFDLTKNESLIFKGLDSSIYKVTYHTSKEEAQTGTSAVIAPINYHTNEDSQEIFIRVENNNPKYDGLDNDCFSIASFLIKYDDLPGEDDVFVIEECDYDYPTPTFAFFDLTERDNDITKGQEGISLMYFMAKGQAKNELSPIESIKNFANNTNPQIIYVLVKNAYTGCKAITNIKLVVLEGPNIPNEVTLEKEGLKDKPEHAWFKIDSAKDEIMAKDKNVSISYHFTREDAVNNVNASSSNLAINVKPCKDAIYARVYKENSCYKVVTINLVVKNCTLSKPSNTITTLKMYPNPTSNIVNIKSNQFKEATASLRDVSGKLFFSELLTFSNENAKLNISQLPKGLYFITLQFDGKEVVKKLVIK